MFHMWKLALAQLQGKLWIIEFNDELSLITRKGIT
jgi:hypothetical protein